MNAQTFTLTFPCYREKHGDENPKISIDTFPLSRAIELSITTNPGTFAREVINAVGIYDLYEAMTEEERKLFTATLHECEEVEI